MTISSSELKWFKSLTVGDTSANGGKMSANESVSNVKNNVFPDVSEAERTAGKTRYRKLFAKVANDDDDTLFSGKIHATEHTPGNDYMVLFAGTQVDTQNDITGSERQYGGGGLTTNVSAGATAFDVTVEDTSLILFINGDTIWIGDGVTEEYHENVTISKTDTTVTITLDTGDQLANDYTVAGNAVGASVYESGDIKGSYDNWVETSGFGTYDEATTPPEIDNLGSIEETWTVTRTSATAFDCAGAAVGAVGSGNISGDFSPNNPDWAKPYFILRAASWGGTWTSGDTIVFKTHPAAQPMWFKEVVPAGSSAYSNNTFKTRIAGEAA